VDRLVITGQRLRDLTLIVLKLVDVGARAGFVLTATYALPIAQAGQFGLIVTLVGLFAFAFNFERHIDIQRRTAGEPQPLFDLAVSRALGFFAVNWVLMTPVFVVAVALLAHVGWTILALSVVVVVAEHLSNLAYHYALISTRYRPLLMVVTAKNIALACVVLYTALFARETLDLTLILWVWAIGGVLSTVVLVGLWLGVRTPIVRSEPFSFSVDIFDQHRASSTHFVIGLLAILTLQFDRLAVGALLNLDQVGLFFRHTLLVSLAYQAFNIISFNRIMPQVYAASRVRDLTHLAATMRREYAKTLIGAPLLLLAAWLADRLTGGVYTERFHLSLALMGVMLLGFMLRAAADFHALVLNARHREADVLRQQSVAFTFGAVVLGLLTWRYGIYGAASAGVFTSGLYLVLVSRSLSQAQREEAAA
jgi:O-antigen/teichoic acid export membrane protein